MEDPPRLKRRCEEGARRSSVGSLREVKRLESRVPAVVRAGRGRQVQAVPRIVSDSLRRRRLYAVVRARRQFAPPPPPLSDVHLPLPQVQILQIPSTACIPACDSPLPSPQRQSRASTEKRSLLCDPLSVIGPSSPACPRPNPAHHQSTLPHPSHSSPPLPPSHPPASPHPARQSPPETSHTRERAGRVRNSPASEEGVFHAIVCRAGVHSGSVRALGRVGVADAGVGREEKARSQPKFVLWA